MAPTGMGDEMQVASEAEGQSLDLVQRMLVSFLVGGIVGMVSVVLALFVVNTARFQLPYDSVIGLWVMCGVVGLIGAVVVLLLNRRRPYHPLALVGLLPMAVAGYFLFA